MLSQRPSSATAAGNARAAATIADKLPEPSCCKAGRRFAAALWLGVTFVCSILDTSDATHLDPARNRLKIAEADNSGGGILPAKTPPHAQRSNVRVAASMTLPTQHTRMESVNPSGSSTTQYPNRESNRDEGQARCKCRQTAPASPRTEPVNHCSNRRCLHTSWDRHATHSRICASGQCGSNIPQAEQSRE